MIAKQRSLFDYVKVSGAGFAMGVANVIPGVSGGTMAFILGVFEEIIESIRAFACLATLRKLLKGEFKELYNTLPWRFLLALFAGVAVALGSASVLFTYLLVHYPSMTYALFFGLILASVFCMFDEVKKWNFPAAAGLILGALFAWFLITLVPAETPNNWYMSLGCGVVVICAMILPGISGSFLLLLFGQYNYVWGAVANISKLNFTMAEISTLFWTAVGAVIGLGGFVHFLNFLLSRARNATMATLIGFMIGSLWRLWPWQQTATWAVKTNSGKVFVNDYNAALEMGGKIEQAVVKNVIPGEFNSTFWMTCGILFLGVVVVLVLEMAAKKKTVR